MKFLSPKNLKEVVSLVSNHPNYKILAGGTDLCVQMNCGTLTPEGFINIWGLNELRGIIEEDDHIEIGALATHREISSNKIVKMYFQPLADSCKTIGAVQIQNRGTLAGNVMNASPAGDSLPVLLAYDAKILAVSKTGTRVIDFKDFYTGYKKTALKKDEFITKFQIPKAGPDEISRFVKIGQRKAQAISKVVACFRLGLDGDAVSKVAIAFGSVAETPIRLSKSEKIILGNKMDKKIVEKVMKSVEKEVTPIDDIRSTGKYRRHICKILVKRFLYRCQAAVDNC